MPRDLPMMIGLGVLAATPVVLAREPLQPGTPRSEDSRAQLRNDPVCIGFDAEELPSLIAVGEVRKDVREADVIAAPGEPEQRNGAWWRYPQSEDAGRV